MRRAVQLALVALGFAATPSDAAQVLYAADGAENKLYRVDAATGATQLVGSTGMSLNSIAIRPSDGAMFGMTTTTDSTHPGQFVTVDRATGASTLTPAPSDGQTMELAFAPDGSLFGWLEYTSDDLVRYDPSTYQTTTLGDAGVDPMFASLASDSAATLYFADADNGALSTVDKVTSALTPAATLKGTGTGWIDSMAFSADGTLFGIRQIPGDGVSTQAVAELVTIDRSTGDIAVRGPLPPGTDALAFDRPTPDPSPPGAGEAPPPSDTPTPPQVSPPDTTAPTFSAFSLSRKRFRVARAPKSTRLTYALSEPASVTFTIYMNRKGRWNGRGCKVGRTTGRRCVLATQKAKLTRGVAAGTSALTLSARVGGRRLKPGSYTLRAVARDTAGNASGPRSLSFEIVR